MTGMQITFNIEHQTGVDAMGNPVMGTTQKTIDDCLIAPITEPTNAREQLALEQAKDQIRIHLPKTCSDDVANSTIIYNEKVFKIDSDSVVFMTANTPTRWNRYFRAEAITL